MTFNGQMSIWLGKKLEIKLAQIGRGHTKGDTIAYLEDQKICFAGDLVEYQSTAYAGDCYFKDWPTTLDRLAAFRFEQLVPGPRRRAHECGRRGRRDRLDARLHLDLYTLVNTASPRAWA